MNTETGPALRSVKITSQAADILKRIKKRTGRSQVSILSEAVKVADKVSRADAKK